MKKALFIVLLSGSLFTIALFALPRLLTPPAIREMSRQVDSLPPLPGEVLTDIVYKREIPFQSFKLDIYYPLNSASSLYKSYIADEDPVLVFIHGGSWIHGDKKLIRIVDPFLQKLRECGIAVVAVDYTAGLTGGLSKPIENCRDALQWLGENGREYGLNPDYLGLYGVSAGAHLGMMAIPSIQDNPELDLKFVLEEFGPVDLVFMAGGDAFDASSLFNAFPRRILKKYSPLHLVNENWPPFLIFHGTADRTVALNQSELLSRRLTQYGVPHTLQIVPEGDHGFFNKSQAYWRQLEDQCMDFLLPRFFPGESYSLSVK
ncbi:MAG: alpha/beta hydrolase [Spirochaetales bacterium]|nr:alpha/beta hydrolase [Spirochaetales bacterium]